MNSQTAGSLTPETIAAAVSNWRQLAKWLEDAKARETELRQAIFNYFFPEPKEGANHYRADGIHVAATYNINRKIDEPALDSVMPQMAECYRAVGSLVYYKADFNTKAYKQLPPDQRAIFEQALTIKPGLPSLEIKLGDEVKAEAEMQGTQTKEQAVAAGNAALFGQTGWTPPAAPAEAAPAGKKRGRKSAADKAVAAITGTAEPTSKRGRKPRK